jgi:hypothetical protein
MTYYDTTNLSLYELHQAQIKAISLEKRVYELFKEKNKPMSWSEVYDFLPAENEVSIKRSITNLKNKFRLKKTDDMAWSKYNVLCHKYELIIY